MRCRGDGRIVRADVIPREHGTSIRHPQAQLTARANALTATMALRQTIGNVIAIVLAVRQNVEPNTGVLG